MVIIRSPHCNMQATLQRAVGLLVALRGTNSGSCHFAVHFNVRYLRLCLAQTAGRVIFPCTFQCSVVAAVRDTDNGSCHFHCTVLADLCGASVCLFRLLNVVYLPIYAKVGLVVGMTKQMSNGKEGDIVNC